MARYRDDNLLLKFVSDDHVTLDEYEGVQAMARAAHQGSPSNNSITFPALDSMITARSSIQIDPRSHRIRISDKKGAKSLADTLKALAQDLVSDANAEDRSRTSRFAVA